MTVRFVHMPDKIRANDIAVPIPQSRDASRRPYGSREAKP